MSRVVFSRAMLGAAVLLTLSAGCSSSTEPRVDAVGQYVMHTRNGQALPVVISTGDSLLSGQMVFRADSTYTLNPRYRTGGATPFTTTIAGTWSVNGSQLSYYSIGVPGAIATGSVITGAVTFVQSGVTYGFVRQ